ncbi:MAG: copper-binding protein [Burkholderiaceae bacterium]|nr:copper-binding protein [Burkholderiaceae bacterium]
MKHPLFTALLAALALLPFASRAAQPGFAAATTVAGSTTSAPLVDGLVKRVDPAAGRVTIAHGPIPNIGMPAMTMVFKLKDPSWGARLKVGEQIRFSADEVGGQLIVTRLEGSR